MMEQQGISFVVVGSPISHTQHFIPISSRNMMGTFHLEPLVVSKSGVDPR